MSIWTVLPFFNLFSSFSDYLLDFIEYPKTKIGQTVELTPNKFFQVAAVLLPISAFLSDYFVNGAFARGVLISGGILLGNLLIWIWVVRRLLQIGVYRSSPMAMSLFLFLKLTLLATLMFIVVQYYPPISVVVGNSVVVLTVLLPSAFEASRLMKPGWGHE